jgi:hypothetical protein
MPDSQVKLNDVIEFIGVYTFDPELATPSDNPDDIMLDLIEDVTVQLPPSKVCILHSAFMYNREKCWFDLLLQFFALTFDSFK